MLILGVIVAPLLLRHADQPEQPVQSAFQPRNHGENFLLVGAFPSEVEPPPIMDRLSQLKKILEIEPQDVFTNYALGLEYLENSPQQAEAQLRRVLELDTQYVPAYFQLGKLAADQDSLPQARAWLEKGIEIAEKVGDHHALGEMQDFLDQLDS